MQRITFLGILTFVLIFKLGVHTLFAQSAMTNVSSRKCTSLNGKWNVIIDPTDIGNWRQVWLEKKPDKKTDFVEYSFDGGPQLAVPADFNSQMPELTHMEGTVWYKQTFSYRLPKDKRVFLHFGAVNYFADVYLNGSLIGKHEGGFTPFQFEITDKLNDAENVIVVRVNNQRAKDGIPSLGYDWLNYGGITRDVNLIETPKTYIDDYFVQLKKNSLNEVLGWVKLKGDSALQKVNVVISELNLNFHSQTNSEGLAEVNFTSEIKLWSPEEPKLYKVIIETETDTVIDEIGFRSIEVVGNQVFLNGKPIFLKAVNIHEENPLKKAKAVDEKDAALLLGSAKELGCNLVRLAHYPHNEYTVKLAEKMGLMVWDEIPVYQHIEFSASGVTDKMSLMAREMIKRDRNRCSVVFWCISNETYSFTPNRDVALIDLAKECRLLDSTRLLTTVINNQGYDNNTLNVWDTLYRYFDVMSVNEYIGWYIPWQGKPSETKWSLVCPDKPLFISEFGGEALYGSNFGPKDEAAFYSEEYQEQIYKDQIELFKNAPNLVGVCPWLLFDYRSLGRMHPVYQIGYNRKGLLSDGGEKKKAWFVMRDYYKSIRNID